MAELRIGNAERDEAIEALGEHFAQGRITAEEFDERTDAAMSARTRNDLRVLFADLPGQHQHPARPVARRGRPPATPMHVLWPVAVVVGVVLVLSHLPLALVLLACWLLVTKARPAYFRRHRARPAHPGWR